MSSDGNSKPHILVFTTSYRPFIGGAEIAIQEVARRLRDRFDFTIITSRFSLRLPKREIFLEGEVIRAGFGSIIDKLFLPIIGVWIALKIIRQGKRPVLLWGMDISQGSLAATFVKWMRPQVPFVLVIQYGYGEMRIKRGRLGLINFLFRFMLRRADFLVAESKYLLDAAKKYNYQGPATVIPNGIDLSRFKPAFPAVQKSGTVIITVGRLVPKNATDILIKAITLVKKKVSQIKCHIVGDGPERKKLEELTRTLGLEKNINFLGQVAYVDVPKYLQEADIFARPSRFEGMGNSFVEAMSVGLPIIGTPVEGILDIIEDGKTGLFARVDDPEDLAKKIILLLQDFNLSRKIRQEGQKMVVERFTWESIKHSYYQIFEKLLRKKSLRIVIAAPIFFPKIGGPALYAKNLSEQFTAYGQKVKVVSFAKYLPYPSGMRHFFYFVNLFFKSFRADILFSLDYFTVGLPAAAVSSLLEIPLAIRMEGDFLWESFVERTKRNVALAEFYKEPQQLSWREKIIKKSVFWALKRAGAVVFSSEWRREMVTGYYKLPLEKTAVIGNAWPYSEKTVNVKERKKIIIWAGRMLYLKNLERLVRVFARANDGSYRLELIGDGPGKAKITEFVNGEKIANVDFISALPHEQLLQKISEAAFVVLPSFSEVGPNLIAEAVAAGAPFIMTRESGYSEYVKDFALLVNPFDGKDIEEKLCMMMDEKVRDGYRQKLFDFPLRRDWQKVAREWLDLFRSFRCSNLTRCLHFFDTTRPFRFRQRNPGKFFTLARLRRLAKFPVEAKQLASTQRRPR